MFKKFDIIIYLFLIFITILPLFYNKKETIKSATMYHKNKKIKTFSLDTNSSFIYHTNDCHIKIIVKSGKLNIVESDCSNKICMKMGSISKNTPKSLICIPQQILIVPDQDIEDQIDGISY